VIPNEANFTKTSSLVLLIVAIFEQLLSAFFVDKSYFYFNWRERSRDPNSGVASPKLLGGKYFALDEQQYFVWDTVSPSKKWLDMVKIIGGEWPHGLPWLRLLDPKFWLVLLLSSAGMNRLHVR